MKFLRRFHWPLALGGLALTLSVTGSAQSGDSVEQSVESRRTHYAEMAMQIWNLAEVGYQEVRSSEILQTELKAEGFWRRKRCRGNAHGFCRELRGGFAGDRNPRRVRCVAGNLAGGGRRARPDTGIGPPGMPAVTTCSEQVRLRQPSRLRNGWSGPVPPERSACTVPPPKKEAQARCTWFGPAYSTVWKP